jgi:hypothetical protein
MRTILTIAIIVNVAGCSHTRGTYLPEQNRRTAETVPVITQGPRMSERARISRERRAEQESLARTEVSGSATQ